MLQNTTPDAAESSAGDDFHILWAIQKCLKLINFDEDDLKAISVENLSNEDHSYLDTSGGMTLGVDLTEYYGGTNFLDSNKVIVSQLKYSTRTPNKNWTVANICTSNKGTGEGSIIDRLCSFYSKLSDQVDRKIVLNKLKIKLVSNRPASNKLIALVKAVQEFCNNQFPKKVTLLQISATLKGNQVKEFDRLFKTSNLDESRFIDFMNVLDFSNCNEGSRFELEQQIIAAISSVTSFKTSLEFAQLHKLIWGKMMPEQRYINTIKLSDVLYAFGFGDISSIFPVTNKIESSDKKILREQLDSIKVEILDDSSQIICLHGGAGIGKSTVVQMISNILPQRSVSIVFDCYGGGSYLDPDDRRHKHSAGIMQLCNELSLKTGSDLLLTQEGSDDFYLKQFKERVNTSLAIIRTLNPEAILTIILDAADNSVTAADVYGGRPFVKDLVNMEFDEGCRIILSARTERIGSLDLPIDTKMIELLPFSYNETLHFLNRNFKEITEDQVKEFRKLTRSIPRVMTYALELPGKALDEKMLPLKPNGKTLEQIFKLRIKEAERKSNKSDVSDFLKSLIALPRPIPFEFIRHVTSLSEERLADIRVDLWREVIENRHEFTFRDEDFETFLRKMYKLDTHIYTKIANALLAGAEDNEYASMHLANFLSKSGMHTALRELVIEKKYLTYPLDPVKNKEVFIERVKLAMRNALIEFKSQDFIKLLVVSAEAAKTNKVLEEILFEKPDLAAKYGNIQTNQKIYFQSGNPGWFGRVHYRNAAIYSRQDETKDLAKQHLQKAKEWGEYRKRLSEDEMEEYGLSSSDLAFGAEAILHLSGPESAVEWIQGWRPKRALYHVIEGLLKNLIVTGDTLSVDQWLQQNNQNLRVDVRLLLVQLYFLNGLQPPIDIESMLKDLQVFNRMKMKLKIDLLNSMMAFCEYCLKIGLKYDRVKVVLDIIQISVPNYPPGFYSSEKKEIKELDLILRKGIIFNFFEQSSFGVTDFYPIRLKESLKSKDPKEKSKVEDEEKRFKRIYSHLLPAYEIRASYFFKNISPVAKVETGLKDFANDWELNYYQRHDAPALQKFILLKLLDISFHQGDDSFLKLIKHEVFLGNLKNIELLLSICEKLSKKNQFSEAIIFLLENIEKIIDSSNQSGREIVENYTRAAVIGSLCSDEKGKYYFDKMVAASSEIDLEAFDQIRSIRDLTNLMTPLTDPVLAVKFFRYSEYCAEKLRNWDGFPWHVVIPTLAKIDISTAFAAVCQWDHRYVRSTGKHYMELISEALEQGFMPVDIATSMLAMNKYYYDGLIDYYKIIFEKIDDKKDHNLKNEALKQIIRDIKLHIPSKNNTDFIRNFLDLFKSGKFADRVIVEEFEDYILKLESIMPTGKESVVKELKDQDEEIYENILQKQEKIDHKIIEIVIENIRSKEEHGYVNFRKLFLEIASNAREEDYIVYLDALIHVEDYGVCYSDFEFGLKACLDSWSKNTEVKKWTSTAFDHVIQKWFSIYFYEEHINYDSLKRLADILRIDETKFGLSLVKLIPEQMDGFSSSVLYQMLTIIYPLIDPLEQQETLAWILDRWDDHIPKDYATVDIDKILSHGSSNDVIAHFIRYNLGHPKKKVRWIAGHVLRRLAKFNNGDILKILLDLQNEHSCHPFQDQENAFYWISAKLYLWITIHRISKETPEVILPLSKYMLIEIRNRNLPHAQIRYFVQSSAIAILEFDPDVFSTLEIEEIENTLISPLAVITTEKIDEHKERKDLRFSFDSMDTLPYWYQPLGRIFGIGQYEVAEIADKFITEYWGYVGDIRKDDHIRDADYNETSNRHGSEPGVENLRTYYEYHGMFCAATTLLKTKALVVIEDSWRQTWDEWIERWTLCWKDFWLSDFNEPTPLVKKYWINNREGNSEWEWAVQKEDFDSVLGLTNGDPITVFQGAKINIGKDYESISLRSGLVSPITAAALMRLYQTRPAYDNYISFENDSDHDSEERRSLKEKFPEFNLVSWLFEEKTEIDGIDDNDPLFKNISKSRIRPGNSFFDWSNCEISNDHSYTYLEDDGIDKWLSKFTTWSDINDESYYYGNLTSEGAILVMRREVLKSFLQHVNKDLIIKIEIERRVEARGHKYYPDYNKVYLIKADGNVETISGNHSTW